MSKKFELIRARLQADSLESDSLDMVDRSLLIRVRGGRDGASTIPSMSNSVSYDLLANGKCVDRVQQLDTQGPEPRAALHPSLTRRTSPHSRWPAFEVLLSSKKRSAAVPPLLPRNCFRPLAAGLLALHVNAPIEGAAGLVVVGCDWFQFALPYRSDPRSAYSASRRGGCESDDVGESVATASSSPPEQAAPKQSGARVVQYKMILKGGSVSNTR